VAVFNTTGAFMVQVQITKLNEAPAAPAQILQHELLNPTIKNKSLPVGGRTVIKGMQFSAVINDPDVGDSIHVEIEIQPTQVFFTGVPTVLGAPVTVTAEATPVLINVPNLVDGAYHWQVRTVDAAGEASPWVSFGANSEVLADFTIDSAALSVPPLDFEDHGSGDCTLTAGVMPRLAPGLALILAALLVRIRRAARA
jgi:hypothetical protein